MSLTIHILQGAIACLHFWFSVWLCCTLSPSSFNWRPVWSFLMTSCFLSYCWHIFLRHFFLGSSDDCPLCFPLLAKVVQDRFLLDHLKKRQDSSIFQDSLFSFSIFANWVIHLTEMHWADTCCLWQWTIFPCSANFGNPMIFLLMFLGKSRKTQMLLLWVSIAEGNTAVVGHIYSVFHEYLASNLSVISAVIS